MNMTSAQTNPRSDLMSRCIEACRDCHATCVETTTHCLRMGGEHAEVNHVTLMQDCAQICELSEDLMLRSSQYMNQTCILCADICEACAESCDKFSDEVMRNCANRCRSCADACREMATGGEIHNRLTSFS